jgi:MFS family permease
MAFDSPAPRRLAALQHRDFRLLWMGYLISFVGSQMQLAAIDWHVYELLRGQSYPITLLGTTITLGAEALGLGTLGLVRIVPIVVFALVGGMVADSLDRRRVMLVTQTLAATLAGTLAVLTLLGHDRLLALYLLTSALAATNAFDNPARQSLVPNLVPREHLTNAVSLNTLSAQIGTVVGPMVAGLMISVFNIGWVYALNAVTFLIVVAALLSMRYRRTTPLQSSGLGWGSLVEGLRFTYRSRIIWGTMLLDFFATFFSSARTMLPIVAGEILGTGAVGYGLLRTAQPAGALIAGATVALRRDIRRQGMVLLVSVVIYGLATALFGISTVFALSYVLFALTGAADTVSTVIRGTIRQMLTPDHLRGRMTSVNMIFFMGGPQLGELEAGLVGAALGVPFAIVSGGVATVLLTAWIAWRYPRLRRYTSDMLAADAKLAQASASS